MAHQSYEVIKKFIYKGYTYESPKKIVVDSKIGEWMVKQGYVKGVVPKTKRVCGGCGR